MFLVLAAVPAAAQTFSDSYTFLKAVRDRDAGKVMTLVGAPGSTAINARDRGSGDGALHIVVRDRDGDWLSVLLGRGARSDIQNNRGETPLGLAAQIGWIEGVQALLARRASIDLANGRGETPLILAVRSGDIAMVRLLLSRGANPKKTDHVAGLSALDYARQNPRAAPILKMLEAKLATAAAPVQGPKR
jgi:ankyrin repeat protein